MSIHKRVIVVFILFILLSGVLFLTRKKAVEVSQPAGTAPTGVVPGVVVLSTAKDADVLEVNNCTITPDTIKVQIGEEFTIKNTGTVKATIYIAPDSLPGATQTLEPGKEVKVKNAHPKEGYVPIWCTVEGQATKKVGLFVTTEE
jgi:hypothetical protein